MDCGTTDRISFQQKLFAREQLTERWPALNKYICSANTVEAAYSGMLRHVEGKLDIPRGMAKEALDFYNKVVLDGRYIEEMLEKPGEVASKLELKVSPEVLDNLRTLSPILRPGGATMNVAVVAIAVAVTVVIVKASNPLEEIVINQSGQIRM